MKQRQRLRLALAFAACTGWVTTPPHVAVAAEPAIVPDIRLDATSQLQGRLTDADGRALAGFLIQLQRQTTVLATATTSSAGEFKLQAPHGGLFTLTTAGHSHAVRCWTRAAAPPHALPQFHVVHGPVQRGQSCTATSCTGSCGGTCGACGPSGFAGNCMGFLMNPIVVGTAIAAAIAIPLAVDDDDAS